MTFRNLFAESFWRGGRVVSVAGLVAVGAGCGRNPALNAPPPPPPLVTVAPAHEEKVMEWEEFTGRTEAVEMVEVRPRVSGHIQEVQFQSGQMVKKGDVLFVIDPRWHQAEFDRREAEYRQAVVRLETAEREAARTARLLEKLAISTEEADQRQARYQEAKAGLLAAEAARDFAKLDLEHTQVRAPIDGRVSRALITVGNFVAGLAGSDNLLTTLVSVDPIYVYADMDENALLRFRALEGEGKLVMTSEGKAPVEMQLADETGFPRRGSLESFDNRLNARTGSILVRAIFPNPEGRIVPGLFARIRLPAGPEAPRVLVEETAIGTDQARKFVLALSSSNTAAYKPVKLGGLINGRRVVREGLEAGEKIIVNGLARVRPGMPVTPVEGEMKADAASAAGGSGQH